MKRELMKTIEGLPDNTLGEALDILKKLSNGPILRYDINSEIGHIIEEDSVLLKRLAE